MLEDLFVSGVEEPVGQAKLEAELVKRVPERMEQVKRVPERVPERVEQPPTSPSPSWTKIHHKYSNGGIKYKDLLVTLPHLYVTYNA